MQCFIVGWYYFECISVLLLIFNINLTKGEEIKWDTCVAFPIFKNADEKLQHKKYAWKPKAPPLLAEAPTG